MTTLSIILTGLVLALLVIVVALLVAQSSARATFKAKESELERSLESEARDCHTAQERAATLETRVRELEIEAATMSEKAAGAERAREEDAAKLKQLREAFDAMAAEALDKSAKRFFEHARETFENHRELAKKEHEERAKAVAQLVAPIGESLKKTDEQLKKLETERLQSTAKLHERFENEERQRLALVTETRRLSDALRKPEVRGRYGEIQLQRVAELAGMTAYCDFDTQSTVRDSEGKARRPDMVVRLPNDRVVVVDAKANIDPYMRALEAENAEEQEAFLERFADGVSKQAKDLARKEYWSQFRDSPEFVVMFVPGDQFVDAALARRPGLLDEMAAQGVILASPSTLIGLLRAVHVGWREKAVSESARELLDLGHELHERSAVLIDHVASVGKGLTSAVNSYNKLVGSVDQRLMPTLRRFEDAGAKSAKTLEEPEGVEVSTRPLRAPANEKAGTSPSA